MTFFWSEIGSGFGAPAAHVKPRILMSTPPPPDPHSKRQQEALLAGLERVCYIFHENHDISRKYARVTSSYRMLSVEINKKSRKSV